jgi:hypothetical protein
LTPRPELEAGLVAALKEYEGNSPGVSEIQDPFQYVAGANYVVPMLFDLAVERANATVERVPRYSSVDHSAIWSSLLAAISRFDAFKLPYLDHPLATDPVAEALLDHEHGKLGREHAIASFERGLWRLVEDDEGVRIELTEPARRSALHLVANKAEFLGYDDEMRSLLRKPELSSAELAMGMGVSALDIFAASCPDAWQRLLAGLPFSIEGVPWFRAFVLSLGGSGRRWYSRGELYELWTDFERKRGTPSIDREELEALTDFHSASVAQARGWGLQSMLLRFDELFALWPFVFHVLHPDLNFLSMLTRRHRELWDRTLGSELALVADWLADRLQKEGRPLLARPRRRRKGIGEVDLALLNLETGDVLALELKTVFDKFRTTAQLSNFTRQRVNFAKAIGQAKSAADAIRDGRWAMRELFGKEAPAKPASVTAGVLTWWDTYNPTLADTEPTVCCNFATLEYLVAASSGIREVAQAILDLSRLYCPGVLEPGKMRVDGEEISFRREVQTDLGPSPAMLDDRGVCRLAREAIADIAHLPDDWETQRRDPADPAMFTYPTIR